MNSNSILIHENVCETFFTSLKIGRIPIWYCQTSCYLLLQGNLKFMPILISFFQTKMKKVKVKLEDTFSNNPWCVDDATAFLKFCCPECDYHIPDLQMFSDHAVENHIKSSALFGEETKNEEGVLLVKQEELEYENNDEYLEQNDAMQTDDYASYSQYDENQGNLLRSIDKKTVRNREFQFVYLSSLPSNQG